MKLSSLSWAKISRARSQADGELHFVMIALVKVRTDIYRTCPQVQPWLYGYNAIEEVEIAVAKNPGIFAPKSPSPV